MPNWQAPPTPIADTADRLTQIYHQISERIGNNPSFYEMAGVDLDSLMAHTKEVVGYYTERAEIEEPPAQLRAFLVQLYISGFIVGIWYQKDQAEGE